eukprot:9326863-Heterocapsa_arctica.AAC.1
MTEHMCTTKRDSLAREGAAKLAAGSPGTEAMAEAFSQEHAVDCMDLLGNLDQCMGDPKKQSNMKYREKYKPATTGMAVIVPYRDMGK